MEQKKEVFSLEPVTRNKELLGASIEKGGQYSVCLSTQHSLKSSISSNMCWRFLQPVTALSTKTWWVEVYVYSCVVTMPMKFVHIFSWS